MSANEILPNLWLGDIHTSQDHNFHKTMNIRVVVNCTKTIPFINAPDLQQDHIRIPVDDNLEPYEIQNMSMWSYEAVTRIIKAYKQHKPILIHCHAGIQRSAAITAMTLIVLKNTSSDKAIQYIRKRRSIAFRPRINFHAAILQFENTIRLRVRQQQHLGRPMSSPSLAFSPRFSEHTIPSSFTSRSIKIPSQPQSQSHEIRTRMIDEDAKKYPQPIQEFRYQPAFQSSLAPIY
jgi:protein-tyrosine phosphatase